MKRHQTIAWIWKLMYPQTPWETQMWVPEWSKFQWEKKRKKVGAHSLICHILKVGRHVGALRVIHKWKFKMRSTCTTNKRKQLM